MDAIVRRIACAGYSRRLFRQAFLSTAACTVNEKQCSYKALNKQCLSENPSRMIVALRVSDRHCEHKHSGSRLYRIVLQDYSQSTEEKSTHHHSGLTERLLSKWFNPIRSGCSLPLPPLSVPAKRYGVIHSNVPPLPTPSCYRKTQTVHVHG